MELFTVVEAAKAIGITPTHTRRLLRRGKIMGIKFGREWIIDPQSVRRFKPRKRVKRIKKGGQDAQKG
jgi:excisionase family DNA binding protein